MREMTGISSKVIHPDLTTSRTQKDEKAVDALVTMLENTWTNPFGHDPCELISLSTGASASPEVASDLMTAAQKRSEAYEKFKLERFEKGDFSFYHWLPRLHLKTFSSIKKTTQKVGNKEIVLKSDHRLFSNMLLIASNRKLDIKEVLQLPLGPLPWALANGDGTL